MGQKRRYRSQNLESVKLDQLLAGRDSQDAIVGVDVSKGTLHLAIRWPDGRTEKPIVVQQPEQLVRCMEFIKQMSMGRKLKVALEPTGTYGDPFRFACHRANVTVERVSPLASSRYAETFDNTPSQHDGKDAGVIAELCANGKAKLWVWESGSSQDELQAAHIALMGACQDDLSRWSGRLEAKLARHWPELGGILKLDSVTLLQILIHYQSPAKLAADDRASAQLSAWGRSGLSAEAIASVVSSARSTQGVPMDTGAELHMKAIAQKALAAKRDLKEHQHEVERLGKGIPMVDFLGKDLGRVTAAVLYHSAGDPAAYPTADAYLKAFGLNLAERSSGKHKGQLHISKRGSSVCRQLLFLLALRLLQKPGIAEWYQAKVARDGGKKKLVGVTAVMRKVTRAIHHCCRTGEAFDTRCVFQERHGRKNRRKANKARRQAISVVEAVSA